MNTIRKAVIGCTLISSTTLYGCNNDEPDIEKLYCIQNKSALYGAWGIASPGLSCPYAESDRRNARLYFSDGTSVDILPGPYGNGGIFLQDMNCNGSTISG